MTKQGRDGLNLRFDPVAVGPNGRGRVDPDVVDLIIASMVARREREPALSPSTIVREIRRFPGATEEERQVAARRLTQEYGISAPSIQRFVAGDDRQAASRLEDEFLLRFAGNLAAAARRLKQFARGRTEGEARASFGERRRQILAELRARRPSPTATEEPAPSQTIPQPQTSQTQQPSQPRETQAPAQQLPQPEQQPQQQQQEDELVEIDFDLI
jgi:hypothetical protein